MKSNKPVNFYEIFSFMGRILLMFFLFLLALSFVLEGESHYAEIHANLKCRFPDVILKVQGSGSSDWIAFIDDGSKIIRVSMNEDKTSAFYSSSLGNGSFNLHSYGFWLFGDRSCNSRIGE